MTKPRAQSALKLPSVAAAALLTVVAAAQDLEPAPEIEPARLIDQGNVRQCLWKLKEPTLDGQQVGDLEVIAVATIGADGKVGEVVLPSLETLTIQPWAKNRVQRWANCVIKAMKFEPGRLQGEPVESEIGIPLKSWSEAVVDRPGPRKTVAAKVRSGPEAYAAAYRECVRGEVTAEYRVLYQFSVDEDGRARGARVLDSSTDRDLNRMGHCMIERLDFEPQMFDGSYARVPVHWSLVIAPQPGD